MRLEVVRELLGQFHAAFVRDLPPDVRAAEEHALARNLLRYRATLEFMPRTGRRLDVVDIGSGWGHIAYLVQELFGYEVVAVDRYRPLTPYWAERFRALGIDYEFCDLTRERLPFADGSFDVALLCEVIEHLPIDPREVLADVRRVLRPGGALVLSTPNFARLENRLKVMLGRPVEWYGDLFRGEVLGHIREYTPEEVFDMLDKTGFKVEKAVLMNYSPPTCLPGPVYRVLTRLFPSLRECLLVRARTEP